MTGPYARAARLYRSRGWQGVLPVTGKSHNLPVGFTGRYEAWPTDDDIDRWVAERGDDNIALRVPDTVLGIDVDAYDGRLGLQTLEFMEERYGQLPATWTITSRTDGSGIRLFSVRPGGRWVSDLGRDSDIQIVRHKHRYAVTWPSIHPDTNGTYQIHLPIGGGVTEEPPHPAQLPPLPDTWVAGLTQGRGGLARELLGLGDTSNGTGSGADMRAEIERGRRVDPEILLLRGVPPGEQDEALFRYLCRLRALNLGREEAIALGMVAVQRFENSRPEDPWTMEHVVDKVNRVWRDYQPGTSPATAPVIAPSLRAWALPHSTPEAITSATAGGETVTTTDEAPTVPEGGIGGHRGGATAGGNGAGGPARPGPPAAEVEEALPQEPLTTDLGNTMRFVRLHGERLRFAVDASSWYVWDGNRWQRDQLNTVMALTVDVINDIRFQALATADPDERNHLARWALTSEAYRARQAIIKGAEAQPELVCTVNQFDRDPDLLVVRNGTLDLHTGELRASRIEDLNSRQAAVTYDPDARCPRWEEHIRFISHGDEELARYMQAAIGYSLTGQVGERTFFFLEGDGNNGKNAFIEPVVAVLGEYAIAGSEQLLTGGHGEHPTVLADLLGARFVFVDETRAGRQLNAERIKALVGSKRVKARHMRQDFFEFDARFKLWIAGNGKPRMNDPSDGVWNRLHEVPCLGKVGRDVKLIKRYGDVLYEEEAAGILNWALAGLADWRERGLVKPDIVTRAVQEHRDEEDWVGRFLDECVEITGSRDDKLTSNELFESFAVWATLARADKTAIGTLIGFRRKLNAELSRATGLPPEEVAVKWRQPTGREVRGVWGVRLQ